MDFQDLKIVEVFISKNFAQKFKKQDSVVFQQTFIYCIVATDKIFVDFFSTKIS